MNTKQSALLALVALPVDIVHNQPEHLQKWTVLFACLEEMFHDEDAFFGYRHPKVCNDCAVCWLQEHEKADGGVLFSAAMSSAIWKKPIPGTGTSTKQPMLVMGRMKVTEFEGFYSEGFHPAMYFHHFAYKSRNMFQGEFLVGDPLAKLFTKDR